MWTGAAASQARRGAGVEEWEELLHPGPQAAFYPTLPHDATPIPHFPPPPDVRGVCCWPKTLWLVGFGRWVMVGRIPRRSCTWSCSSETRKGHCAFRSRSVRQVWFGWDGVGGIPSPGSSRPLRATPPLASRSAPSPRAPPIALCSLASLRHRATARFATAPPLASPAAPRHRSLRPPPHRSL